MSRAENGVGRKLGGAGAAENDGAGGRGAWIEQGVDWIGHSEPAPIT